MVVGLNGNFVEGGIEFLGVGDDYSEEMYYLRGNQVILSNLAGCADENK